ncbi:MAG TPA: gamma carbonic anhydrase family protein [Nannocystaceae bacterium]|nr:gamma carbonic anhydrase family protein [Nannocystaceae bacterium]
MTSRTVAESVVRVDGPPVDLDRLQRELETLRGRCPGAIFERYLGAVPRVAATAFVAPGAAIVGDVELGDDTSVWFGCVLRGDVARIVVRERSNVQDGSVLHVGDLDPTIVGEEVVIGHRAVVHGCTIGGGTLVGIQSTILDGARIGEGCIIGSCALVTAGAQIPAHSLVLGIPGKVVRTLTAADEAFHRALAGKYTRLAHNHRLG